MYKRPKTHQAGEPFLRTAGVTNSLHPPARAARQEEDDHVLGTVGAAHAIEGLGCNMWRKKTPPREPSGRNHPL